MKFPQNINLAEKKDIAELQAKIDLNKTTLGTIEGFFKKKGDEVDDVKFKANAFSFLNVIMRVTGISLSLIHI